MTPNEQLLVQKLLDDELDLDAREELKRAILLERLTPELMQAMREHLSQADEMRAKIRAREAELTQRFGDNACAAAKYSIREEALAQQEKAASVQRTSR